MAPGLRRNEKCDCGSGLKYKCCCLAADEELADPELLGMGEYLMPRDLWRCRSADLESVEARLLELDPETTLRHLGRLNLLLHWKSDFPGTDRELAVVRNYSGPTLHAKIQRWLGPRKRDRVIPRILILGVMSLIVRKEIPCPRQGWADWQPESFIESVIRFAAHLESDIHLRRSAGTANDHGFPDDMLGTLFRFLFLAERQNVGSAIGRFWLLLKEGFPGATRRNPEHAFDVSKEFRDRLGCTIEQMLGIGLALYGKYSKCPDMAPGAGLEGLVLNEEYFRKIPPEVDRNELDRAIAFFARTLPDMRARQRALPTPLGTSHLDVRVLYESPALRLASGALCLLDGWFLESRFLDGWYWAMFDSMRQENLNRTMRFREATGVAVEWYVGRLLEETMNLRGDLRVWLDSRGDISCPSGVRRPDAVIGEGARLYFLEVTSSAVLPSVALSGDFSKVRSQLESIWFGDSPKLVQLANSIKSFADGSLVLNGLEASAVEDVTPILVSLRPLPQVAPLVFEYRRIISGHTVAKGIAESIQFWDLDELEGMATALTKGLDWADLFARKRTARTAHDSWNNYLHYEGPSLPRHPMLATQMSLAGDAASKALFPP